MTICNPCPIGTFQGKPGKITCEACSNGTYADRTGSKQCIDCSYRLSSKEGSTICSFCSEGFYLKDSSVSQLNIFQNPFENCLECPSDVTCDVNTTLQTMVIEPGFWRDSINTSTIYQCENDAVCRGSQINALNNNSCSEGLTGLLCEVCENEEHPLL